MFVTFGQVRNNLADLRKKDNVDKQDLYQAVIGTSIQELNDNVSAYRFACVVGCLLTLGWATQMSQGLSHDLEYLVNCNGPNTTWIDVRRTVMSGYIYIKEAGRKLLTYLARCSTALTSAASLEHQQTLVGSHPIVTQ